MQQNKKDTKNSRKVFISVLGAGFYGECIYSKDNFDGEGAYFQSSKTRYVQQATLELLTKKEQWDNADAAYILVTQKSKELNWNATITSRKNRFGEAEEYHGLERVIKDMNLPFETKAIDINDGLNESEIWNIFETLVSDDGGIIQDGDHLYFDLTHGFRYLPMLVLVLGNYTKFLKGTKKCSITYGNFEMQKDGVAPIIDLLPLATLQDWSFAVADYLENGYTEQLKRLANEFLTPILRNIGKNGDKAANDNAIKVRQLVDRVCDVALERQTCRGIAVMESKNVKMLKENINSIQGSVIKAFTPLIKKIETSLKPFNEKCDVMNTIAAARWCFENYQYQSATTFLEEGVISFFCQRHNIDYKNEDLRGLVTGAFTIKKFGIPYDEWKFKEDDHIFAFLRILKDPLLQDVDFVNCFYDFCSSVRNDYNHCGFRSKQQPLTSKRIVDKIDNAIENIAGKLKTAQPLPETKHGLFVNLTNHPHSCWSEEQLSEAGKYGEIVDIAFPMVEPDYGSEEIKLLSETYIAKIEQLTPYFNITLHIMGEMTFTYTVISRMKSLGIICLASTTERNTVMSSDGKKISEFKFVQFREY